jgi:hypothetical protein
MVATPDPSEATPKALLPVLLVLLVPVLVLAWLKVLNLGDRASAFNP